MILYRYVRERRLSNKCKPANIELNIREYRRGHQGETGKIGYARRRQTKQKNTTQYVLDNTIHKQTQIT